jgi:DNA-binding transcriptional LysR family regulator
MDLNLLLALDALLREGSVTRAADRMHLSAPAMSRTLARIREATGDPILVRAGRQLVPTPRAVEMRDRVRAVIEDGTRLLCPAPPESPRDWRRSFTIRTNDGFVTGLGTDLLIRLRTESPGVVLRFAVEGKEDVASLREGVVDLDVGVQGPLGPELRVQTIGEDHFVILLCRSGSHASGPLGVEQFAAAEHVIASRRGRTRGPLDDLLEKRGLRREVRTVVPSLLAACVVVTQTDALATVPSVFAAAASRVFDVSARPLPMKTAPITLAMTWHPRFDVDPLHRFVRTCIREIARKHGMTTGSRRSAVTRTSTR